jgi:dipeptidyl aminopeptidase/acylaminoacyl peptidase
MTAALFALSPALADARTITLFDLRREVSMSDPQISPDGSRVALLVGTNDFEHDLFPIRIDMIDVATGTARTLPISKRNVASVRWSPDGAKLAFLASPSSGSPRQVYVSSIDGTRARQLTKVPTGVEYFAWRPDGQAIAYVAQEPPPVRQGPAKYDLGFEVGDNDYLTTAAPLPSQLWLVGLNGGSRRLTSGSRSLPPGEFTFSQPYLSSFILPQHMPNEYFCWASDRSIIFTQLPDAYITHTDRAVMIVLDVATGKQTPLTARSGLEAGCDASPDGKRVAYWYPRLGGGMDASSIFVVQSDARGDNGKDVTHELDRSPWQIQWMPDGASLLVLAHDATREGMWVVDSDARARRLDIGDLNPSGASVSRNGTIAFIASGPQRPTELYVLASTTSMPRQLTSDNAFFATLELGAVRRIDWTNGGWAENGVLTYPPGFVAGKRYPLVLQIHGWPQYASQEAFDTDYPGLTQLLAAHGYLVFEPNYRGSDNMGNAFETAIVGDSAAGPSADVMAGVAAVERLGIVDTSRVGVSGWSYGGLLTAWLIGHHSWKAAMAGAAPTDLPVDYAIGSYNVLDRYFYGRSLWDSRSAQQMYVEQSPITDAWDVTTPTLIMSSIYDTVVPVTHSYELYHALKSRGVPVEFIAYPSSEHFPTDPVTSEDIYRRWVGWFDRYMR